MKKLTFALLLILLMTTGAFAFEQAEPLDFIFKGGEFKEIYRLVVENPCKGTISGPNGITFYFEYSAKCELPRTGIDYNGIETFTAPKKWASTKSSDPNVLIEGYAMGLIHEPSTSFLAWFVEGANNTKQDKFWARELTEAEYKLIGIQSTIKAKTGTNALLVQYAGTQPGTKDVILEITDADAPDKFTTVVIKSDKLPGYFHIPGGGIVRIEKVIMEGQVPIISFEWEKKPTV